MKKILICIFSIILFTGCGSTKLKCEKYEKKAGYDYSESYELVYEKNQENLKQIGENYDWLKKQTQKFQMMPEEALIVTINGKGSIYCQKKEKQLKKKDNYKNI